MLPFISPALRVAIITRVRDISTAVNLIFQVSEHRQEQRSLQHRKRQEARPQRVHIGLILVVRCGLDMMTCEGPQTMMTVQEANRPDFLNSKRRNLEGRDSVRLLDHEMKY